MGKRSSFQRRKNDAYLTFDKRAYPPLFRHLPPRVKFWEPCAGRGDMALELMAHGHECILATDIRPQDEWIFRTDALAATAEEIRSTGAEVIITNPAWTRSILHPMIVQFSDALPTWLLFDADWVHTAQAEPFLPSLRKVVSVGRLCWIEGTNQTGKDNVAWHLFDKPGNAPTEFYGRAA